jgi:hypothetical protein
VSASELITASSKQVISSESLLTKLESTTVTAKMAAMSSESLPTPPQ